MTNKRTVEIEQLTAKILSDPVAQDIGVVANQLLAEFHAGYPVEPLRSLLVSTDTDVVKIGIWIASEIGSRAKPLFGEVAELLTHREPHVRFFAIDSVLSCATDHEAGAIARVVSMIDDPDRAVRWKALGFLFRASRVQISAAIEFLMPSNTSPAHIAGLEMIRNPDLDPETVSHLLQSDDWIMRRFAVAAAARMARASPQPLIAASMSTDEEVASFANDMLDLSKP